MAVTPYERAFGIRSLNGLVERFAAEANLNTKFQDLFTKGRKFEPDGETVEWDEVQLHRHLAPTAGRDSPFVILEDTTKVNRSSANMHIKLMKRIPAAKLYSERAPGELRANAQAVIDLELKDLVKTIRNLIEYACANTLNGDLNVTAAAVPGSQILFRIQYAPNTYTAAATWAAAATNLLGVEFPALKQDHLQSSGMVPRRMIVGGTIQGYLGTNTTILNQIAGHDTNKIVLEGAGTLIGQALEGFELAGLKWEVNEAGYVPQGGAFTRFMPATDVGFLLPDDAELPNVLGLALGRGFVPAGNEFAPAEAGAELVQPAPQRGFYSYAKRSGNPATDLELCVGWVGLPILLDPAAITVLDAVP